MEPVGLLDWPDELLLHLSHYLGVRDIHNCCLVCRRLREVLNDDEVWRRRVPSQAVSRLGEQQVTPALPSVLGDLGEQRTLYARATRLLNNWRSGHCVQFDRENPKCQYRRFVTKKKWYQHIDRETLVYGDRYLFVARNYSNKLQVWDVHSVPELFTTVLINNNNYNSFFIVDAKLVIVECIKVLVYQITLPERDFPLLYSFLITQSSVTFGVEVDHTCVCSYSNGHHEWRHFSVDQYLVSNRCIEVKGEEVEEQQPILEVWDIAQGSKIGSFPSPFPGSHIRFECKLDNHKWIFSQRNMYTTGSGKESIVLEFDANKKERLDFILSYTGYRNSIIGVANSVFLFARAGEVDEDGKHEIQTVVAHDVSANMELASRQFSFNPHSFWNNWKSTVVFYGKIIFLCKDSFHVVDALSLETLYQFPCEGLEFITHQFKILNSIFVLVASRESLYLELWDIENRRKVDCTLGIDYGRHVYLNNLANALVYLGLLDRKVHVVHFW